MNRKVFTDEEIEMLRKNPYTYAVTPKMIKFTHEFKKAVALIMNKTSAIFEIIENTVNNLICDHAVSLKQETIIRSDQRGQYTSHRFIQILKSKKLRQSMPRKGKCWDNAPQESFFGHMKDHIKEKLKAADDFETVKRIVDDCIDYYNTERYQRHLAKLSPDEYYQFCTTREYPITIPAPPVPPTVSKRPEELGRKDDSLEKPEGTRD